MSFFNELKRRNVFRVGAAYLVVAWLVLQVIDTVGPIIELSDGFARGVLLLLVIGFPIVLVVSWVFELTPEGLQTQAAADASGSRTYAGKLNALIIGGLVLALVLVVLDAYVLEDAGPPVTATIAEAGEPVTAQGEITQSTSEEKSIAVLAFDNLSNDPDQDYFSDGLAEEILNKLAKVEDLLVSARTSSFYFKNRDESLREIGEQLGVNYLLEGSVRKSGDQLRIAATLVEADSGFELWSETYDRQLADIFAIQDEIAGAVSTALSVTLAAGEFNRPGMTTNVPAYEAYLQADRTEYANIDRNLEAISHLENAVSIDPGFGLAWNALYRAYEFATIAMPPDQSAEFIQARENALEQTRLLIPNSPEYLVSSAVSQRRMGNWAEAEQLFLRAIDTGNADAVAGLNYGEMLWSVGRLKDAVTTLQRAKRLDPKNVDIAVRLSVSLWAAGQVNAADEEIARGAVINPDGFIQGARSYRQLSEGDYQQFIDETSSAPPGTQGRMINEVLTRIQAGDGQGAVDILREFYETQPSISPVFASVLGPLAALGGDNELAVAFFAGNSNPNVNDVFGSLPIWQDFLSGMRQLEGFKDMVERNGIADYWRTTGNWADKCRPLEGGDDFECF